MYTGPLWDEFLEAGKERALYRGGRKGLVIARQEAIVEYTMRIRQLDGLIASMYRLADRARYRRKFLKMRTKINRAQRYEHERQALMGELEQYCEQTDSNRRYYQVRERLLRAIREHTFEKPERVESLREWIDAAGVPVPYNVPEEVMYYTEPSVAAGLTVHLFYGGKPLWRGRQSIPDGIGHGHHILLDTHGNVGGQRYEILYQRTPR